jgi:hypothetical protein
MSQLKTSSPSLADVIPLTRDGVNNALRKMKQKKGQVSDTKIPSSLPPSRKSICGTFSSLGSITITNILLFLDKGTMFLPLHFLFAIYDSYIAETGDEVEGVVFSCRYLSSFRRIDAIWRAPARLVPIIINSIAWDAAIDFCFCRTII